MNETMEKLIRLTARSLDRQDKDPNRRLQVPCGFREQAEQMTDLLIAALFPRYAPREAPREERLLGALTLLQTELEALGIREEAGERVKRDLLSALPGIRRQLQADLEAAYRGDPAAQSVEEVLVCYPAFPAIAAYRLAHVLYQTEVPLLPRAMTEYAHRRTGIDIHPGAVIGDSFFIDHGTGVVIGETTVIGRDVKLYQHVTLGAKSFEAGPDGTLVKGIRRHPEIGDRVVIYAGATILGGQTQIGSDCIIGGGVWLTHSVPAGKMVLARAAVTNASVTRDIMVDPVLDSAML